VHMNFSCTNSSHELIKFIKKSKKIIHVISILLYLYIKFQVQIHSNEIAIKMIKTDLKNLKFYTEVK
jgi:predicted transcriptional regulator